MFHECKSEWIIHDIINFNDIYMDLEVQLIVPHNIYAYIPLLRIYVYSNQSKFQLSSLQLTGMCWKDESHDIFRHEVYETAFEDHEAGFKVRHYISCCIISTQTKSQVRIWGVSLNNLINSFNLLAFGVDIFLFCNFRHWYFLQLSAPMNDILQAWLQKCNRTVWDRILINRSISFINSSPSPPI